MPFRQEQPINWEQSKRRGQASSPDCADWLLARLAGDSSEFVREVVAANPGCPPRVRWWLAGDESLLVRAAVAKHPGCPSRLLRLLTGDDVTYVAVVARDQTAVRAQRSRKERQR